MANSPLVKTALHGGDPNWGRFVAVAGRAGVAFTEARSRVQIGPTVLFDHGTVWADREPTAAEHLKNREVEVTVDLGTGGIWRGKDLDLRSQCRIRPDQRRLPDVVVHHVITATH